MTTLLEHFGNVTIKNDTMNLHGVGFGNYVNRLLEGFLSSGRLYLKSENFEFNNDHYNSLARNPKQAIGLSPFYGVIYSIRAGVVYIFDKNLQVSTSFATPIPNSDGLATIDGRGNGLIVTNQKIYHLYPNGGIKNEADHNLTAYNNEFLSSAVYQKKDVFYFSLYSQFNAARIGCLGKLSTLEIKNSRLLTIGASDDAVFLKDGRLVNFDQLNTNNVRIHTIDFENYQIVTTTNVPLPSTVNGARGMLGVTKNGQLLFHSNSDRRLISVNPDTGAVTDLLTNTFSGVRFYDFDKYYLYGQGLTDNYNYICDFKTGDLVTRTATGANNLYPTPMQMRGKMPICEAFH